MSTEKPRPLQGYREVQETKKDKPVDPAKFKEELSKVQESDESQQKGKRNLKKSEEEVEDDAGQTNQPVVASGDLFSLFMSDKDNDSMLSPKTPQNIRSTQAPTSSSTFNIEEDSSSKGMQSSQPPALAPDAPLANLGSNAPQVPSPPAMTSSNNVPQQPAQPQPTTSTALSGQSLSSEDLMPYPTIQQGDQSISGSQPSTQESPQRVQKKETKDTSLLSKKHLSSAQIAKKKKETTPEIKLEKAPKKAVSSEKTPLLIQPQKTPLPIQPQKTPQQPSKPTVKEEKPEVSQQAKETYLQKQSLPQKSSDVKSSLTTPLIDKKKIDEKSKKQTLSQSLEGTSIKSESSNEHKDKKDEKETEQTASISQATPIIPYEPTVQTTPAPVYTTLPAQVYELFERMVGVMSIEQHNGVSTTTVTINMKDSVFDGAKIILNHYDTAPNSFNLTIAAGPTGQKLISDNITGLEFALQQSNPAFRVNLAKPALLEDYEEHQAITKKGKVRKTGDEEKEEQKGG